MAGVYPGIACLCMMAAEKVIRKSIKEKYYEFENITNGRQFSQEEIITQLNKKRKQYEKECAEIY